MEASRVEELEQLGMVWSVHASAWDAGLDAVRSYAAVHGHFLPPTTAVREGAPTSICRTFRWHAITNHASER
jgi:hypothetical protein